MTVPTLQSTTFTDRKILLSDQGREFGEKVVLESANTDSGSTPTYRFRKGNVVVLRTATGQYVEADDSNADRNTPASVTADEATDTDWALATITVKYGLGGVAFTAVTMGTTTFTTAAVVTLLNANAAFAANFIADNSGGSLRIRTRQAGADQQLHVVSSLATAFGASGKAGYGADADYRVTYERRDMQDPDGTAIAAICENLVRGHFDESQLLVGGSAATSDTSGGWAEARAVLSRRGSRFG